MKKPYISLQIISFNNEPVQTIRSRKKRRIYDFLQADKFKNCTLNIRVAYKKGYLNEGVYQAKKDLIFALKAFTEKDLVMEFME